jgi:hypothetical protein
MAISPQVRIVRAFFSKHNVLDGIRNMLLSSNAIDSVVPIADRFTGRDRAKFRSGVCQIDALSDMPPIVSALGGAG